jgi:GDP-4-dehydro-6-deoxy-D-mannose reductase
MKMSTNMKMLTTAIVTGSEGFIGSHLVNFLHNKGWNVIGTHRLHRSDHLRNRLNLQFEQCDLRNGQRIQQIVEKYEPAYIFHLGAQSLPTVSWLDPVDTFESNIMGSLYLFEAARHQKRPPVVVSACSSAEYGHVPPSAIPVKEEQPLRPLHPYGISKACLDMLAQEYFADYKLRAVNLRLFNTTGPGKTSDAPSDFVRQLVRIKKGQQEPLIEVGNLETRRAILDVRDTVRGFYLAAMKGHPGEVYNLCASETHTMKTVLQTAMRLAGVKAKVQAVKRLMRPSDEKIIFGNVTKMRRDTGWRPQQTLSQTLYAMIEYWGSVL